MAGMIGGAALLGLFIGSLISGWVSDHIGRQKIFTLSFVPDYRRLFLQFLPPRLEQLIGLRILIGIGLGGDYSVGQATLLAEFAPRRHRGILLGAFSVVWTIGYVLANLAGHHFISETGGLALAAGLVRAAGPAHHAAALGTPESPRWLLRQGRFAGAHAVVRHVSARTCCSAMRWWRQAINASERYFHRFTGGERRLTASSSSAR